MSERSDTTGVTVVVADEREASEVSNLPIETQRWQELAAAVAADQGATGELTLTFVDVAEMTELNREHMSKDGPTDVLSFPMDDDSTPGVPRLLGDIVISPAVAAGQYADHAGTLDDELALLIVHGILHVLGHDHAETDGAALMRRCELDLLERHHWRRPAPAGFRQTHD